MLRPVFAGRYLVTQVRIHRRMIITSVKLWRIKCQRVLGTPLLVLKLEDSVPVTMWREFVLKLTRNTDTNTAVHPTRICDSVTIVSCLSGQVVCICHHGPCQRSALRTVPGHESVPSAVNKQRHQGRREHAERKKGRGRVRSD